MNLNEYQQLAGRTLLDTPDQMPTGLEYMLMWNGLGLAGEAGEIAEVFSEGADAVDRILLTKELGDVLWYAAAICSKLGIALQTALGVKTDPSTSLAIPAEHMAFHLVAAAAGVADTLKKQICHRHGLHMETLIPHLGNVVYWCQILCAQYRIVFEHVLITNIQKLAARYPEGYSSDASKDWQATR